jgi:hypothetical protein
MVTELFLRNARSQGNAPLQRALIEALSNKITDAAQDYERLRDYWDGQHPTRLTDRLKQFLRLNKIDGNEAFRDNFCGVVVEAMTDRMAVQAFTVPGEASDADGNPGPAAQFAQDVWALNRCDAMQKDVYGDAAALGDAFAIVEWDPERQAPRISFNPPELVHIEYDGGDYQRALRATKRWMVTAMDASGNERGTVRLNVYYPDRIEKYAADTTAGGGGNWEQFSDPDDGEWPLPWTFNNEPIGIPVVHFRNNPRGHNYGRSELSDVVSLQDAVNKALVDGVKIMDAQGWAQRWASGIEDPPSEDLQAQPGALFTSSNDEAKFGQFEAANPEGVIAWMEMLIAHIASTSRTPQHLFRVMGGQPSGEALKTAEAPLVAKIRDRQIVYGNAWEDAMRLAVRLQNANAEQQIELPDTGYSVVWEPAESRPDPLEQIETVNAKEGISRHQRLREYGYDDEEIERMDAEREQEEADLAEGMAQAFDRGGGGVPVATGANGST